MRAARFASIALFSSCLLLLAAGPVADKYSPAERRHWAFQPRQDAEVPQFSNSADRAWIRNPVDAFILARLQKEGLRPAPPADKRTLIRRVYYDLTGLPPSPAEVESFLADKSPEAYEKLIDRLLASPHYGERWAQHWLDVVRFAESDGFEYDTHRPYAYRYRDYVIQSFNQDKPYNRFLIEQLAGDELGGEDEFRVASGLQRLGPLRKNAGNQEVASSRNEVLTEMTNLVGSAFLGVTLGCARCHDHKFDPIRQKDYYRIQAYFAAAHEEDVVIASEDEKSAWEATNKKIDAEVKELRAKMKELKGEDRARMQQMVRNAEERRPGPLPSLFSVRDDFGKRTPVHVLARGEWELKGDAVGMRPLGVLLPDGAPELDSDLKSPRLELARWIAEDGNPLTARVMANRIWHYHFGRGIVATPNDFGRMGARPKHPELLDWLANRFVENGWRVKPIHHLILLSSTYRQSGQSPLEAKALEMDPDNALHWRYDRRRLTAEEIRDSMLAAAGRLNPKTGGPSVIVPVEKELVELLYKPAQWAVHPDPKEHDRRSVYLIYKRNLQLPFLAVFDAPDLQTSCARRESSTHAPQALELLNGAFAIDLAKSLAARLDGEARTPEAQVDLAYRLVTGRPASAKEKELALEFLKTQPLSEFALAVLNLNDFLYVN
jgi:hypothetical protein